MAYFMVCIRFSDTFKKDEGGEEEDEGNKK